MGKEFARKTILVTDASDGSEWAAYTWTVTYPDDFIEHQVECVYLMRPGASQASRVLWVDVPKSVKTQICSAFDDRFEPQLLSLQDQEEAIWEEGQQG